MTDYLTALRQHTERYLEYKVSSSVLRMTPIEYIITYASVIPLLALIRTDILSFCQHTRSVDSGGASED